MPFIIEDSQDVNNDTFFENAEPSYYTLMKFFRRAMKEDYAQIFQRLDELENKLNLIIEKYELKKEIVKELTKLQVLNDLANTSQKVEPVTEVTEVRSVDVKTE